MRRTRLILLGALLAVLAATTALASIGPAEPAFPIAAGPGFQRYPDVASQPGDSYTVVFELNDSIWSRRYGPDDQPHEAAAKLVSTTNDQEERAAVAAAAGGSLVVA